MFVSLALTLVLFEDVICQDCNWILRLDCSSYGYRPLCGSDYVTYPSRCHVAKRHCQNPGINILSETSCEAAGFGTFTTSRETTQTTEQSRIPTTYEFRSIPSSAATTRGTSANGGTEHICSQINSIDCLFEYVPNGDETLCASNNQTYQNFCFYSKVRCRFPQVHVVNLGQCSRTTAPTHLTSQSPQESKTDTTSQWQRTSVKPTPCSQNPCQHGGSCEGLPGTYHCHCTSGYFGQNCEQDYDECRNSPCKNGGSCINTIGSYKCVCSPGFSGFACEFGSVVCEDTPSFPCDYMLQYNMCNKADVAIKCGRTCFQDVVGFPCADMLKFGMCNDPGIKEKCKNTCRKCPQLDSLIG